MNRIVTENIGPCACCGVECAACPDKLPATVLVDVGAYVWTFKACPECDKIGGLYEAPFIGKRQASARGSIAKQYAQSMADFP